MASTKEKCPKCGNDQVALAKDTSGKRFCQTSGCMHVWTPMTKDQVETHKLKTELAAKEAEVIRLREQVRKLISKYEPKASDGKEIFE